MQLPTQSSFFFRESGISKCEVVRNVQQNHGTVAFAGDGRPDLEPALMVQAKITFRNWGAGNGTHVSRRVISGIFNVVVFHGNSLDAGMDVALGMAVWALVGFRSYKWL